MDKGKDSSYAVMIPCSQEDFAKFISTLLGKPQTLERRFSEPFEVTRQQVENTFHLVDQRVRQQNEASLTQFTVRILYDDQSSVLLNSLEDFKMYAEIRPLISIGVDLTWIYLIRFQGKQHPEKQQIEVSFRATKDDSVIRIEDNGWDFPWLRQGQIHTEVNHTARTWGVDIDSLLQGHIKTLMRPQTTLRKWITKHHNKVGLIAGVTFLLITLVAAYAAANTYLNQQLARVAAFHSSSSTPIGVVEKLDFLIQLAAEGGWPRFAFMMGSFGTIAVIASIFFGVIVAERGENRLASFVTVTDKAVDYRGNILQKEGRRWLSFVGSVVLGLVVGLASNAIFKVFLEKVL